MKKTLYIKNMVCPRCKNVVNAVMQKFDLQVTDIQLGEVEVFANENINLIELNELLKNEGFELIFDREKQVVEKIKAYLLEYLEKIEFLNVKLSDYLATKTDLNYTYLSKIFSTIENTTIEKYFILLKIEKVKELLSYQELSLSEISYQLAYSSVQALSNQFKKITGITVSEFKEQANKNRKS
ncbi:MAG: helix-turn-helix transcriptional regulator [Ignavibacteria bacterium]|nr:helix-turn-helix transcriptional regulator [Ignavibacteria bacterium]